MTSLQASEARSLTSSCRELGRPLVSKAFLKCLAPEGTASRPGAGGDRPGNSSQRIDLSGWLPSVRCQASSGTSKKFI